MDERPTHLDLFSGIGGFALAAQWAGFRTIGFCEIDKYCQKVLAKNFMADTEGWRLRRPEQERNARTDGEWRGRYVVESNKARPIVCTNIFELNGRDFAGVSLITGGFPCQPFSVAGKRRGAEDDRAIWPQMFRVISEARPAWVLGENVPGIIPMELDNVLSDLEGIGYATRAFVIPACAVDARHRRDRLWIVGRREMADSECEGSSRLRGESNELAISEEWSRQSDRQIGLQSESVSNPEHSTTARQRQHGGNGLSESEPVRSGPCCWDDEREWSSKSGMGRVVDGLSLELDFARQIAKHEKGHSKKAKSARNTVIGKLLQAVWEHRELAKTSPALYVEHLLGCVPEVPLQNSQGRWLLGARIQEEPNLLDLWSVVSAEGFTPAQNVQQLRLLERAWSKERGQTVGGRVNRLKGLGNAIVPQVAYEILREIRKLC